MIGIAFDQFLQTVDRYKLDLASLNVSFLFLLITTDPDEFSHTTDPLHLLTSFHFPL